MKIIEDREKEYKDWHDKNNDEYSRACLSFAERWAELLEAEIKNANDITKCVINNADILKKKADTENITGAMYSIAIGVLLHYWKYGEYLQKWINGEL